METTIMGFIGISVSGGMFRVWALRKDMLRMRSLIPVSQICKHETFARSCRPKTETGKFNGSSLKTS